MPAEAILRVGLADPDRIEFALEELLERRSVCLLAAPRDALSPEDRAKGDSIRKGWKELQKRQNAERPPPPPATAAQAKRYVRPVGALARPPIL